MKIGVLTFSRAENNGAMLQCFALYTVLKKLGHDVEIIDYRTDVIENSYIIGPKIRKNLLIYGITLCHYLVHKKELLNRKEKFNEFRNLMRYSKSYSADDLNTQPLRYDAVIAGSDQLWNPHITKSLDEVFFLNFKGDFKRYTYAMSMGSIDFEEFSGEKFRSLVSQFDAISMREKDASDFMSDILNSNVPQVLDPTLLLDDGFWNEQISGVSLDLPAKYIFIYNIIENEELYRIAAKEAERLSIPLIFMNLDRNAMPPCKGKYPCKMIPIIDGGPLEFVYLIRNAKKIVTSSFHGTAFSCLFRKDVIMLLPKGTGSRVKSIAELFGIENRIFRSYSEYEQEISSPQRAISYHTERYKESFADSVKYLTRIASAGEQ